MQKSLFSMKTDTKFGGTLLIGKRKSARPLCTKRTIHLVLKSEQNGLLKSASWIQRIIAIAAKRWGVRIYRIAVVDDHIHLLIRIPTRIAYRFFIQRVSGAIALKLKIKWAVRPFTRVVAWGRAFKRACSYIEMNFLEAFACIPAQPRGPGAPLRRHLLFAGT